MIKEEEKYDGYYSIVTSELHLSDSKIIEKYKCLWKIEETFKVTKTQLKARPAFVWSKGGIEGHFLTCFLSLLLLRILEMKTNGEHSIEKMIDSISKANMVHLDANYYKAVFYSDVLACIDAGIGTNLNQKYRSLEDIKKMIADTK